MIKVLIGHTKEELETALNQDVVVKILALNAVSLHDWDYNGGILNQWTEYMAVVEVDATTTRGRNYTQEDRRTR